MNEETIQRKMERFSFESYDRKKSWEAYIFLFEKVCKVKGLVGEELLVQNAQRDLLLAYIGSDHLQALRNHNYPKDVDGCTYSEIKQELKQLFCPQHTIFASRMQFERTNRLSQESFTEYADRLKQLSSVCDYGSTLDERLRDRFVAGANHQNLELEIRQRWPEGKFQNRIITFAEIYQVAINLETAENELKERRKQQQEKQIMTLTSQDKGVKTNSYSTKKYKEHEENMFTTPWKGTIPKQQSHFSKKCGRCGKPPHYKKEQCPALNAKCRRCPKIGHFAALCTSKVPSQQRVVQDEENPLVAEKTDIMPNNHDDEPDTSLQNLKGTSNLRAVIQVKLNGVNCCMEYDSGAQLSTISEELWKNLKCPTLQEAPTLRAYGQKTLDTVGITRVNVTLDKVTKELPVAVIKAKDRPLFGLPWILAFELDIPKQVKIKSTNMGTNKQEEPAQLWTKALTEEFGEVFSDTMGTIKATQAKIHLKPEAKPIAWNARRVPFPLRKAVEKELARLQQEGVIEKVDPAVTPIEWATPTVNVVKPDRTVRICGDFRVTINPHIIPEKHLMPTFEELTAKIAGGELFTVIDLKDAYLQLEVQEESRKYLVIATHIGYFRYKRLPFGLTLLPAIFQRFMENLFAGIEHVGVFLDDVIVTGPNVEAHQANLREVLRRMKAAGLRVKLTKTKFLQEQVTYLGYNIDRMGIHPTDEKLRALKETSAPKNVKELRSFLGAIKFYERFVPNLHTTVADLHKLTSSRQPWKWTARENQIFEEVKAQLSTEASLITYNENLPIVLCCDASEKGLGSVLMHRLENGTERPIAYASRTLKDVEKKYSTIDKEALAIIFGITKFHQYIYGRHFTLITDHKPLEQLFGEKRNLSKVINNRLSRWAVTLTGYDFTIEYRKGKENVCADFLSRLPLAETTQKWAEITTIQAIRTQNLEDLELTSKLLRRKTNYDPVLCKVKRFLETASWPSSAKNVPEELKLYYAKRNELSIEEGTVMWGGRIVIPLSLQARVLEHLHQGHPGMEAMKAMARFHVWWPYVDKDVEKFVNSCIACQENRSNVPELPLYPWDIPDYPWERIHVDVAGPQKGKYWLVAVDALSKWIEIEPIYRKITSKKIITCLRRWFASYGIAKRLVTDNSSLFTSEEFEGFCKANGTTHVKITPYHPKSNGLAERLIRTFKNRYAACRRDTSDEHLILQRFLMSYRNTPHRTTNRTPAELFLGRRLPTCLDFLKPDLKGNTIVKIAKQKLYHDHRTQNREFEPGENVWVKHETSAGWYPGNIERRTGPMSYEIISAGVIKRKHADQLRPRVGAVEESPFPTK